MLILDQTCDLQLSTFQAHCMPQQANVVSTVGRAIVQVLRGKDFCKD